MPEGTEGHIVSQVKSELEARGYDEQQINAGGLRITTTISKPAQDAAAVSIDEVMQGEPGNLRQALVAVDPRTGAVIAYHVVRDGIGTDYAQAQRQPGF